MWKFLTKLPIWIENQREEGPRRRLFSSRPELSSRLSSAIGVSDRTASRMTEKRKTPMQVTLMAPTCHAG